MLEHERNNVKDRDIFFQPEKIQFCERVLFRRINILRELNQFVLGIVGVETLFLRFLSLILMPVLDVKLSYFSDFPDFVQSGELSKK